MASADRPNSLIPGRGGHATVALQHGSKKKLLVFGGGAQDVQFNDLYLYNIATGTWKQLITNGVQPKPRYGHSATLVDSAKLVCFGGYAAGGSTGQDQWFNDTPVLDLATLRWAHPEVKGAPQPRYAHSATLIGHQIAIFGGCAGKEFFNDLWVLDLEECRWTKQTQHGKVPSPRSYHSTTCLGNKLVVFGGKSSSSYFNDCYVLYWENKIWHQISLLPAPSTPLSLDTRGASTAGGFRESGCAALASRAYHTAVLIGSAKLCIIGGYDGTRMFREILAVDLATLTWHTAPSEYALMRCKHTCTAIGSEMFVCGGHDGSNYVGSVVRIDAAELFPSLMGWREPDTAVASGTGVPASPVAMAITSPRRDKSEAALPGSPMVTSPTAVARSPPTNHSTPLGHSANSPRQLVFGKPPAGRGGGGGADVHAGEWLRSASERFRLREDVRQCTTLLGNLNGPHFAALSLSEVDNFVAILQDAVAKATRARELMAQLEAIEPATPPRGNALIGEPNTASGQQALRPAMAKTKTRTKKARQQKKITFGEVEIREFNRMLDGGGAVPNDDGPPLGLDWSVVHSTKRNVSSFEFEREGKRLERQEFMKKAFIPAEERYRILEAAGHSRSSLERGISEVRRLKQSRRESKQCPLGVMLLHELRGDDPSADMADKGDGEEHARLSYSTRRKLGLGSMHPMKTGYNSD